MCGRFSFSVNEKIIEEIFGVEVDMAEYKPRYNCAPSQNLAVITSENPHKLSFYRWGLIPSWAKDSSAGNKMINARAETLAEKPSFRQPFKSKRCLIPADSFYEWKKDNNKTPFRILMKNEEPFAMAGIWDKWCDAEGKAVYSFSVITTRANELIKDLHNRMPVIIAPQHYSVWINSADHDCLYSLLKPYPDEKMQLYPISKSVNSAKNDMPEIHERTAWLNFSGGGIH